MNKRTWGEDVESLRTAMGKLRRILIDSWAVAVVNWLDRKFTG